ncbi:hypothetical protein K493DRAFT_338539, partial [Basidiobolus meristosporus CBS 931.73]
MSDWSNHLNDGRMYQQPEVVSMYSSSAASIDNYALSYHPNSIPQLQSSILSGNASHHELTYSPNDFLGIMPMLPTTAATSFASNIAPFQFHAVLSVIVFAEVLQKLRISALYPHIQRCLEEDVRRKIEQLIDGSFPTLFIQSSISRAWIEWRLLKKLPIDKQADGTRVNSTEFPKHHGWHLASRLGYVMANTILERQPQCSHTDTTIYAPLGHDVRNFTEEQLERLEDIYLTSGRYGCPSSQTQYILAHSFGCSETQLWAVQSALQFREPLNRPNPIHHKDQINDLDWPSMMDLAPIKADNILNAEPLSSSAFSGFELNYPSDLPKDNDSQDASNLGDFLAGIETCSYYIHFNKTFVLTQISDVSLLCYSQWKVYFVILKEQCVWKSFQGCRVLATACLHRLVGISQHIDVKSISFTNYKEAKLQSWLIGNPHTPTTLQGNHLLGGQLYWILDSYTTLDWPLLAPLSNSSSHCTLHTDLSVNASCVPSKLDSFPTGDADTEAVTFSKSFEISPQSVDTSGARSTINGLAFAPITPHHRAALAFNAEFSNYPGAVFGFPYNWGNPSLIHQVVPGMLQSYQHTANTFSQGYHKSVRGTPGRPNTMPEDLPLDDDPGIDEESVDDLMHLLTPLVNKDWGLGHVDHIPKFVKFMRSEEKSSRRSLLLTVLVNTTDRTTLRSFSYSRGLTVLRMWIVQAQKENSPLLIKSLEALKNIPMEINVLKESMLGRVIRALKNSEEKDIKALATELMNRWTKLIQQEPTPPLTKNTQPSENIETKRVAPSRGEPQKPLRPEKTSSPDV